MEPKRLRKAIDAINTYYSFAVLVYATAIYLAGHRRLSLWAVAVCTPLLAGWTGYLLHGFIAGRTQRYGFRVLSDIVTYEITRKHTYILKSRTKLKAMADHIMVWPVGHRWSGLGEEMVPHIDHDGQQLMALVHSQTGKHEARIMPYDLSAATGGDWSYWFVSLNPPAQKGDEIEVNYSQTFVDKKRAAKPQLNHFVRTPMKRLELNVKFPAGVRPKTVSGSYFKPADNRRPYASKGVVYDPDWQWATWTIKNPKVGYCYRIEWAE